MSLADRFENFVLSLPRLIADAQKKGIANAIPFF